MAGLLSVAPSGRSVLFEPAQAVRCARRGNVLAADPALGLWCPLARDDSRDELGDHGGKWTKLFLVRLPAAPVIKVLSATEATMLAGRLRNEPLATVLAPDRFLVPAPVVHRTHGRAQIDALIQTKVAGRHRPATPAKLQAHRLAAAVFVLSRQNGDLRRAGQAIGAKLLQSREAEESGIHRSECNFL